MPEKPHPTITRYAVTYINKDGMRTLAWANQGRNHKLSREEADSHLESMLEHNHGNVLESVYGPAGAKSLAVREVECYESGDAIGIYFKD